MSDTTGTAGRRTTGADADKNKAGLDALTAAGLLKSLEDRDIHVKRYELTTFGKRVPPRFCYGHRVVTSIDSFTPPAPVDAPGYGEMAVG